MRERRGLVSWTTEIALGGLGSLWSDLGVPSVIRTLKPMRARLLNDHCCLHWSKIPPPPWLSILKKAEMIFPTFDDCFQCGIMGSSSWLDPLHFTCQAFLQTWEVVFFFFFPPLLGGSVYFVFALKWRNMLWWVKVDRLSGVLVAVDAESGRYFLSGHLSLGYRLGFPDSW